MTFLTLRKFCHANTLPNTAVTQTTVSDTNSCTEIVFFIPRPAMVRYVRKQEYSDAGIQRRGIQRLCLMVSGYVQTRGHVRCWTTGRGRRSGSPCRPEPSKNNLPPLTILY